MSAWCLLTCAIGKHLLDLDAGFASIKSCSIIWRVDQSVSNGRCNQLQSIALDKLRKRSSYI